MSKVRIRELLLEPELKHKFSKSSIANFFCIAHTQLMGAQCLPKQSCLHHPFLPAPTPSIAKLTRTCFYLYQSFHQDTFPWK